MRFGFLIIGCFLVLSKVQAWCQNEPDGSFVADPSSQWDFFYCRNGQATRGTCADGGIFDPVVRLCMPSEMVPIIPPPAPPAPPGLFPCLDRWRIRWQILNHNAININFYQTAMGKSNRDNSYDCISNT